jgi:parallel beta-helix repeat protein
LAPPGARLRGTHRLLRSDDPRRSRKSPAPAHRSQIGVLKRTLSGVPYNHFSNILIDSNLAIRQTDPKLTFATYLQGIDAFDEEWTNVTVSNNVVVTSACWGISFSSAHNSKIINNTVVADGMIPQPGNCKPIVVIGDKTHEGPSSSDNIIRNHIANGFAIYDVDPDMTMDHNICLGINGKCQIVTYENGKPKWNVYKPGMHGDHNIIDGRGARGMFVSFDPAKFVYDLRLRPKRWRLAPAILKERLR